MAAAVSEAVPDAEPQEEMAEDEAPMIVPDVAVFFMEACVSGFCQRQENAALDAKCGCGKKISEHTCQDKTISQCSGCDVVWIVHCYKKNFPQLQDAVFAANFSCGCANRRR